MPEKKKKKKKKKKSINNIKIIINFKKSNLIKFQMLYLSLTNTFEEYPKIKNIHLYIDGK